MNSYEQLVPKENLSVDYPGRIITEIIRSRRSIYADEYIKKAIEPELINEILVNASWAPTHKMTEPWRFIVLQGKQLLLYGKFMAEYYLPIYSKVVNSQDVLAQKLRYLRNYPLTASCMIAVIMKRSTTVDIPEWEETASVASAVQNMALTCTAHNLGSYWATNGPAIEYVNTLGLSENERSMGLFFIGNYDQESYKVNKKRTPIDQKTTWLF